VELPTPHQAAPRQTARAQATPRKPPSANALAVLRQAAFRRRVLRLVRDLLAAAHLRHLQLRLRLGLGDPADTGCLWALMGPVSAWSQTLRDARVQIEPEFMGAVLEFQAQGQARLVPLQLLTLVVVFALSPVSLRAWRTFQGTHG
jgi:hypothetical protein